MSLTLLIIIVVLCVLLEGFFSGSEMAVVNANKLRLATSTSRGSKAALAALHLVKRPASFFSTTLLGTNLATVMGSVATTLYIIAHYGPDYTAFALLFWPITLIFGELVPKSLYHYYADRIVLAVAPILLGFYFLFFPIVWVFAKLTDLLLAGLKERVGQEPLLSREELALMIEAEDSEKSDLRPVERTLISRIFDLAEKKVSNIKTPLVDVVALRDSASREEAIRLLEEKEHGKIPVYAETISNVVGILSNTDLLLGDPEKTPRELMQPPYYVSEEMPLDQLFVSMKRRGETMAVVVDEYGGATGVVTSEDLFEEVVGEIRDEHDVMPTPYQRLGAKRFLVSGRMEVKVANERLKLGIPEGGYETIAGFIIHVALRIPRVEEQIAYKTLQFIIRRANDRVVQEVEILVKS